MPRFAVSLISVKCKSLIIPPLYGNKVQILLSLKKKESEGHVLLFQWPQCLLLVLCGALQSSGYREAMFSASDITMSLDVTMSCLVCKFSCLLELLPTTPECLLFYLPLPSKYRGQFQISANTKLQPSSLQPQLRRLPVLLLFCQGLWKSPHPPHSNRTRSS